MFSKLQAEVMFEEERLWVVEEVEEATRRDAVIGRLREPWEMVVPSNYNIDGVERWPKMIR